MTLWEMSISGGILILVILVARRLFQNRLPRRTFLVLWAVALLRLFIPWTIAAPFSVYSLLESSGITGGIEKIAGNTGLKNRVQNEEQNNEETKHTAKEAGNAAISEEQLSFSGSPGISLWKVLYLCGGLICAGFHLAVFLKYRRIFRTSLPTEDPAAWEWVRSFPLMRKVQVRSLDLIATPMTYGVLHPVILLPRGIQWEDSRQMQCVLTHELIHVRRFDTVRKFLLIIAVSIHWFNPLVWVMYVLANRDLELACDEKVIEYFGQDSRAAYAMSLISLAEQKSNLISWGSGFSKDAMEERIVAIMKKRKPTIGSLAGAGILVMLAAGLFAASALQKDTGENVAAMEENGTGAEPEAAENDNRFLAETETVNNDKVPDLEQFNDSEGMVLLPLPKKNPSEVSEGMDAESVWEGNAQEEEPFVLFLRNVARSAEFSDYEKYGLSYESESAHFLYDGEIVGYFKDEMGPNLFRKFTDEEGTVGLTVKRDASWKMTGFTVKSVDEMKRSGQNETVRESAID
jgi:beta-lactamase regulating signal transducer with metallopeptidase domain